MQEQHWKANQDAEKQSIVASEKAQRCLLFLNTSPLQKFHTAAKQSDYTCSQQKSLDTTAKMQAAVTRHQGNWFLTTLVEFEF